MALDPFDYKEPACALCGGEEFYYPNSKKSGKSIPLQSVMSKLDAALDREDYGEAKRLLQFWIGEARLLCDVRGELSVQNELVGLYRKTAEKDLALEAVNRSLEIIRSEDLERLVSAATIILNCATTMKAFGLAQQAMEHYGKVQAVYEAQLPSDDPRLGAFFNNYALALADMGKTAEAMDCFEKALKIMAKAENGALEMAVTYLNMADLYDMSDPQNQEVIASLLNRALSCLDNPQLPRDGYYAFTCRKCAPVFDYYGYFAIKNDLNKRADKIYAGN